MRSLAVLTGEGFTSEIFEDEGRVFFKADADIDADGAPHAYGPRDTGLDTIRNALDGQGRYVGVLTDQDGKPLFQRIGDPAPGYFISPTTYEFKDAPPRTQRRYVNSETVPFIVVPPVIVRETKGIVLGCRAIVSHTITGKQVECVVADVGPSRKNGELSIAAAAHLGIPSCPRTGGEDDPVILYELWPGVPATVGGMKWQLQPWGA